MIAIFLILFLLFVLTWYFYQQTKRPHNFPPGPNWLPVVGNTPELKKLARKLGGQHKVFEQWSKDYNSPILGLKLGQDLFVIALTYPLVNTVHTREEFDGRPDTFFLRLRTMGTRLGITCTDGPLWSEHRSFAIRHLRHAGYGRQAMETQIQVELKELLEVIENFNGKPEWPGKILAPSVINVLWTFTAGTRIPRTDERLSTLLDLFEKRSKAFDMSGGLLSQMPWLRFIAPDYTGYNLIQNFNRKLNEFFMETINEHFDNYSEEKCSDDLIYAYIHEMKIQEENPDSTFTAIQLTMIILDIFIAGSQTTSITLDLALMMMVLRPEIQEKLQNEIDVNLDGESPQSASKSKLLYTQAFLMEVQRFFHIVPISGPRRTLSETSLGGYRVPKNTTVLIGLKSVHMDQDYWKDPEYFRPERFLNEDMSELVNTERVIPFGQGKRKCLGDSLARACILIFFVGILQRFKLVIPDGYDKPSMDLLPGITLSPKHYKIVFKQR